MPKQPSEYDKIRAIWYQKLKDEEGFTDIEVDDYSLKVWSVRITNKMREVPWQEVEAYYYMANQFLNQHIFKSELEKIIWEYHSNGISERDIANLLTKVAYRKTIKKTRVGEILQKLKAAFHAQYPVKEPSGKI